MEKRQRVNPDGSVVTIYCGDEASIGARAKIGDEARIGAWARIETPLHYADGGMRRDGYRFSGIVMDGRIIVSTGCRVGWSMDEARSHWGSTGYRDRALGDETLAMLDLIERIFMLRGLVTAQQQAEG